MTLDKIQGKRGYLRWGHQSNDPILFAIWTGTRDFGTYRVFINTLFELCSETTGLQFDMSLHPVP